MYYIYLNHAPTAWVSLALLCQQPKIWREKEIEKERECGQNIVREKARDRVAKLLNETHTESRKCMDRV